MFQPMRPRCRRRRRKPTQRQLSETNPGRRWKSPRSMLLAQSTALCPINPGAEFLHFSKEPGDKAPDRQQNTVAKLKHGQRRGVRRPAPSWQSRPHLDEGGSSRKTLSSSSADMKAVHGAPLGKTGRDGSIRFRHVDETERAEMIVAPIIADLRPTQRTGAIKIYRRSRRLSFHVDHLTIEPLTDQHGSFMHVSLINDLSNQEIGNI